MKLTDSARAYSYLKPKMSSEVEELWCIALTSQLKIIRSSCIFRGTVDRCMVHPREIFRFAFKANAANLIISHNHPSGDPRPSEYDFTWTRRLMAAATAFNIPILDHVIIGAGSFYSMADQKQLHTADFNVVLDRILESTPPSGSVGKWN